MRLGDLSECERRPRRRGRGRSGPAHPGSLKGRQARGISRRFPGPAQSSSMRSTASAVSIWIIRHSSLFSFFCSSATGPASPYFTARDTLKNPRTPSGGNLAFRTNSSSIAGELAIGRSMMSGPHSAALQHGLTAGVGNADHGEHPQAGGDAAQIGRLGEGEKGMLHFDPSGREAHERGHFQKCGIVHVRGCAEDGAAAVVLRVPVGVGSW